MIPRYSRPEMANIWTDKNRFRIWFEIEAYALEAFEKQGLIEQGIAAQVFEAVGEKKHDFDVQAILDIEKTTKHDVIAFLTYLAGIIGDNSRFVHMGMTSSDILDTALSKQLDEACEILIDDMKRLLEALKKRAYEHKDTICIGRSHGIHAEPTTFGLKMARFYAEFERGLKRLEDARKEIAVCAISGAVGTHANVAVEVQDHVAEKLALGDVVSLAQPAYTLLSLRGEVSGAAIRLQARTPDENNWQLELEVGVIGRCEPQCELRPGRRGREHAID